MESFPAFIFVFFGQVIGALGSALTFLLIGLCPLYIAAYLFFKKKLTSTSSAFVYAFLVASALSMSTVIALSAIVMGVWGQDRFPLSCGRRTAVVPLSCRGRSQVGAVNPS